MDVYNPALQLVKWLTTQTERQGLCWHIDGDIISARLRDATSIQFQVHCEASSLRTWSLLTVCIARGIALRRVTPEALSDGNSGLVAAIDALFLAISHQMPLARPSRVGDANASRCGRRLRSSAQQHVVCVPKTPCTGSDCSEARTEAGHGLITKKTRS
jgi:hypothetical protein